jgi:adenosylcobinamide kinase/adenosylcobinamide-phosphate guanylyltransferase
MYLVIGPNSSGKSVFAEKLAVQLSRSDGTCSAQPDSGHLHYVATLVPLGTSDVLRVEKHIAQRAGLGFITHEDPRLLQGAQGMSSRDVVLLEDVSNLAANCFFGRDGVMMGSVQETVSLVLSRVEDLNQAIAHLVVVAIGDVVIEDEYDESTCKYIEVLSALNEALALVADTVVRVHDGIPVVLKGLLPQVGDRS